MEGNNNVGGKCPVSSIASFEIKDSDFGVITPHTSPICEEGQSREEQLREMMEKLRKAEREKAEAQRELEEERKRKIPQVSSSTHMNGVVGGNFPIENSATPSNYAAKNAAAEEKKVRDSILRQISQLCDIYPEDGNMPPENTIIGMKDSELRKYGNLFESAIVHGYIRSMVIMLSTMKFKFTKEMIIEWCNFYRGRTPQLVGSLCDLPGYNGFFERSNAKFTATISDCGKDGCNKVDNIALFVPRVIRGVNFRTLKVPNMYRADVVEKMITVPGKKGEAKKQKKVTSWGYECRNISTLLSFLESDHYDPDDEDNAAYDSEEYYGTTEPDEEDFADDE